LSLAAAIKCGPIIGLTGGVASGKSYVADQLAARGAHVIDTDQLAREIVTVGAPAWQAIVQRFGHTILNADQSLNRPALRALIFQDPNARRDLEAITHPEIRALARTRALSAAATACYVLVAIPLLREKARYDFLHAVLVVDCTRATQLRRLQARDGVSAELAEHMLAAQSTRYERLAIADHVLYNDAHTADAAALAAPLERLHALLSRESVR
jgi:dephospho-CoA kinase